MQRKKENQFVIRISHYCTFRDQPFYLSFFACFRFTPDFTMSRIRRSLTVFTSLGAPANYTLQATVPPHTLSKCSAALPRPNWEPVLYYSITCVMGFLLFCILVAAYFEADRIFVADIIRRKVKSSSFNQNSYDKSKVFDLKQVAGLPHNNNTPVPIQQKKVPMQTKPPDVTLTNHITEISNGHTNTFSQEKQQYTDGKSFFTTVLSVAKSFFAHKPSNRNKPKINRQNSQEKDVEPKTIKTIDRSKSMELPISEKSTDQQKSKRTKAAKRQTSAEESLIQSTHDKKLSKELNHVDKKVSSKCDKNHHDNKYNTKNNKPVTMTTDIETIEKQQRNQPSNEGLYFRSVRQQIIFHTDPNRIGGVWLMVNMFSFSVVDRGFKPSSGQTKDYKL